MPAHQVKRLPDRQIFVNIDHPEISAQGVEPYSLGYTKLYIFVCMKMHTLMYTEGVPGVPRMRGARRSARATSFSTYTERQGGAELRTLPAPAGIAISGGKAQLAKSQGGAGKTPEFGNA